MTAPRAGRNVRAVLATLLAVATSSCVPDGTEASPAGMARLELGAVFQQSGSTLVDAVVVDARVVIRLVSPAPPGVLVDVRRSIAPQSDGATLSVNFPLQGDDALYEVEVFGSNAAGEVIYHAAPVRFGAGSLNTAGSITVEADVVYVGPGSDAVSVSASPSPLNLVVGGSGTLTATAIGPGNAPITRALFEWQVISGSVVTVDDNGSVVAGSAPGAATIEVSIPSGTRPKATVLVNVTLPASLIVLESGGNQTGPVSAELPNPIVVRVLAANSAPVGGVVVTFAPVNGSVSSTSAITDANGRAQTRWILTATPGPHTLNVTVPGVATPLQVTATAVPVTQPTLAVVSGGGQTGNAGAPLLQPIIISLINGATPVIGATISVSAGQGGSVVPGSGVTDGTGRVQFNWTLGPATGSHTLTVTSPAAVNSPINVSATSTPIEVFITQAAPSALAPGQQSTITAFVRSAVNFQPVNGAVVTFASSGTGNTLTPVTTSTNSQGFATMVFSSTVSETKSITATSNNVTSAPLSLPVAVMNTTGTAMLKASGDNQNVRFGQDFPQPVVIRVLAATGVPVANAFVDFSSANGLLRRVTDVNGFASQLYSLAGNANAFPIGTVGTIDVFLVNNNNIKVTFTFTVIP